MIKNYTTAEKNKLKELISRVEGESKALYMVEAPNCTCSFAAYEQEEMIGFLVAWKSSFHPYCTYFEIIVHPDHTNYIGDLMEALEENMEEMDYPLQTGVHGNSILDKYYQNNNFDRIRKTYLPIINLPYKGNESRKPINQSIKTLDEILPSQLKQLVHLAKKVYEETHLVNPVAEFELDTWNSLIFAEDLIREGSYVVVDEKGEILAYSLLHKAGTDDTVEFGWKGTRDKSDMKTINLLVSMQVVYANRKNYQKIEGEFDTTDPYAMEVLNHFDFPKYPVWITYQKK